MVYNASNNELVRTKTLVKNCIVLVDSLPFRQWYEAHYATPMGRKKGAKLVRIVDIIFNAKRHSACAVVGAHKRGLSVMITCPVLLLNVCDDISDSEEGHSQS